MRFIVDSQVWLWWHTEPERLRKSASDLLEDSSQEPLLSAASVWEIAIKYSTGKLPLPQAPRKYVSARMEKEGFGFLEITPNHALECAVLPFHHRDPFDRMLVAQSIVERIPILTADPVLGKYKAKIIPAD